jgi:corin
MTPARTTPAQVPTLAMGTGRTTPLIPRETILVPMILVPMILVPMILVPMILVPMILVLTILVLMILVPTIPRLIRSMTRGRSSRAVAASAPSPA